MWTAPILTDFGLPLLSEDPTRKGRGLNRSLQFKIRFKKVITMYSPKISEVLIPHLYQMAKSREVRMTTLVNRIISKEIHKWKKKGGEEHGQDNPDAQRHIGSL